MGTDNMEYDQITASHYAAFRPTLHLPILNKCILGNKKYDLGLDIGCGTGQSSIALTNHCDKVIGIEPSKDMLGNSIQHSQIEYLQFNGVDLEFENNQFDIITFAGSWYYAKSQKLLDEAIRVSRPNAQIIVYDFEILLNNTLLELGIDVASTEESDYNHEENFSELVMEDVELEKTIVEETAIQITASNLAHLLLSSKENYALISSKLGSDNLFEKLKECLSELSNGKIIAKLYYSVYLCVAIKD